MGETMPGKQLLMIVGDFGEDFDGRSPFFERANARTGAIANLLGHRVLGNPTEK